MADKPEAPPESTEPAHPQPQSDPAELSEEDLEKVSGGVTSSSTKGAHFKEGIITP
jgi:hypothetical protein